MKKNNCMEYKSYKEEREYFDEKQLIYAPNSIYHGVNKWVVNKETSLDITVGLLQDFIGYLFDYSEHCDHISEDEAREEWLNWLFEKRIKRKRE